MEVFVTPNDDLQHILSKITEPSTIYLAEGVYRQKFEVFSDNIRIVGKSRETTIITYDDYAKKLHADGGEYNTFRTYTVCVTGKNVVMENLTIENSNTSPEVVGQCVALSVNADNFVAKNVRLRSTQDTLFCSPFPDDLVVRYSGLTDDPAYYDGFIPQNQLYAQGTYTQYFVDCQIEGNVDFIFGGGRTFFYHCDIISLADKRNCGYVAAPCHPLAEPFGFSFVECRFLNGGANKGTNYLARPWRDFGKCNFVNCLVEDHIHPDLFDKWNDTYRDHTARFGYSGLTASTPLTPVPWSKQLTDDQVADIYCLLTEREDA